MKIEEERVRVTSFQKETGKPEPTETKNVSSIFTTKRSTCINNPQRNPIIQRSFQMQAVTELRNRVSKAEQMQESNDQEN